MQRLPRGHASANADGDDVSASGAASPTTFVLLEAGRLINAGRFAAAVLLLEPAARTADAGVRPTVSRYLAIAYARNGRAEGALPLLEEAEREAVEAGDVEEQTRVWAARASALAATGDHERALALLRACVEACEEGQIDDETFHFSILVQLAAELERRGESSAALAALEAALERSLRFAERRSLGELYAEMARARLERGEVAGAIFYEQRSAQVFEELRIRSELLAAIEGAARLQAEAGDAGRASAYRARAAEIASDRLSSD